MNRQRSYVNSLAGRSGNAVGFRALPARSQTVLLTGPTAHSNRPPTRSDPPTRTLLRGGVSEWPKEHASKACEGESSPWVQIPPPPPYKMTSP